MAKSNVGPNALGPGTRASSKHWAAEQCFLRTENETDDVPHVRDKYYRASDAERLFFFWLWRKE